MTRNSPLTKNEYQTLIILVKEKCTNEIKSLTLKDIANKSQLSVATIRKSVTKLLKLNYIKQGLCQWKAKSYYATQEGTDKINSLFKEEELI